MNKKYILPLGILTSLILIGSAGAVSVYADSTDKPMHQKFVSFFANKFNLKEEDVENAFEEARNMHREEMENMHMEKLNQAVADGKITEDQKNQLLTKMESMRKTMEESRDLSPEERRNTMEAVRQELQSWATEQNVNLSELGMFAGGPKNGERQGQGMGQGQGPRW